ncbi:TonB-dependent receptor [Massilia cavernae]|uniref:TonB-dependent receptor n=1 Tax=Massilia cavernae TaxID=2320864 RepID=A0A418Y724_9BURK|nr:TonB-dependent receptor [Massilia cavernae]
MSSSRAAFGQLTYSLTPALRLTAGIRRTLDEKSRKGFDTVGSPVRVRIENDAAVEYAVTNGKVGIDYDLSKTVMLYGSFSTGYKAGGFNNGTVATNPFLYYDPERLSALEAGAKGRFLGGRLQLSASAFSYLYKGLQVSTVAINPATNAQTSQTRNAARAVVRGLEVEGKYAINPQSKLDFGFNYLDGHYETYRPTLTTNWAGYDLDNAPRTGLTLGYTHAWDLSNGGAVSANVNTKYSASYVMSDFSAPLQVRQDAFHKTNARLTYSAPGDKWMVQAYVKNIENKDVMVNYNNFAGGIVWLAQPRTYGVRFSTGF